MNKTENKQDKIDGINSNLYQKLSMIREEVAKTTTLKKGVGGTDKFSTTYFTKEQLFELWANTNKKLFDNQGLIITWSVDTNSVKFNQDYTGVAGILTFKVSNIKNPSEYLEFNKPFGNRNPSNNISFGVGSAETYAIRYFYADVMELTANDNDPESKAVFDRESKIQNIPIQQETKVDFFSPAKAPVEVLAPEQKTVQAPANDFDGDFFQKMKDPANLSIIARGPHLAEFQQMAKKGVENLTEAEKKTILSWIQ